MFPSVGCEKRDEGVLQIKDRSGRKTECYRLGLRVISKGKIDIYYVPYQCVPDLPRHLVSGQIT